MIIDAFSFFNEFDILEKRLEYLYNHVDRFVLVECNYTHSGKPKPLHFLQNRKRYSKFLDKIEYNPFIISLEDYNFDCKIESVNYESDHWRLEKDQRQHIAKAVEIFNKEDILIVSDVDEIPNVERLSEISNSLEQNEVVVLEQLFFYYNLNCMVDNFRWLLPAATKVKTLNKRSLQEIRMFHHFNPTRIREAGWHLSYFLGAEQIQKKLNSFAHQEYNTDKWLDKNRIEECIKNRKDLFERENHGFINPPIEIFPDEFIKVFGEYYTK